MKAILFDLDGVLIDSMDVWYKALFNVLKKRFGKKISLGEFRDKFWGKEIEENLQALGLDKGLSKECVDNFMLLLDEIQSCDGSKSFIQELKKWDILLGVVTNTPRYAAFKVLENLGMKKFFDVILGREDVKKGKPDPEMIQKACSLLGVSPDDTLLVGDTASDVKAGMLAGCRVAGIEVDADIKVKDLISLKKILSLDRKAHFVLY